MSKFDLLTCIKLKCLCRDERQMNYLMLLEEAVISTESDVHSCSIHQPCINCAGAFILYRNQRFSCDHLNNKQPPSYPALNNYFSLCALHT